MDRKRLIYVCLALAVLSSCHSGKDLVRVVTEIRTDTLYISKEKRDSIHVRDSIYVREKGDTIVLDRWHYEYVEKTLYDTVYISRTDSIPVEVLVDKPLSWWDGTKVKFGGYALIFTFIAVLIPIVRFLYRILRP